MDIIFESDRINFVKINESLINDYLVMVNDYEVSKMISHKHRTFTFDEEVEWVNSKLSENANIFSMIEKSTNEFIGNIEIMNIIDGSGELGISITSLKQNNHFGTEAIKRIVDYSFKNLCLNILHLNVFDFNKRAIHCYENCGFVIDGAPKTEEDIHMICVKK